MWFDALAALPAVGRHPHAVLLFDIAAEARSDGGHELARLHAALVLHTAGDNGEIERRIQHLLNTYTNTRDTVLTEKSKHGCITFTLQDRRLPPWATITWGRIDDHFVVAVGDGSYDRIAGTIEGRAGSLGGDTWFADVCARTGCVPGSTPPSATAHPGPARHAPYHQGDASVAFYVHLEKLKLAADAPLAAKIERVAAALGLAGVERGLWTLGHRGPALELRGVLRRGGRDETYTVAGPELLESFDVPVIPDEAGGYAVLDCHPRRMLHGLSEAYLAAKSPRSRERSRAFWRDLEAAAGVSIERDIFSQLGGPVVIHDYPQHAFHLPLAWTILMPIEGDAAALRGKINRLLNAGRQRLAPEHPSASDDYDTSRREWSMLQLRRDPDGVWFVQFGLVGPALAVTDRWLVISYSPWAVRANLALLSPDRSAKLEENVETSKRRNAER
jgi:hypothetical protein